MLDPRRSTVCAHLAQVLQEGVWCLISTELQKGIDFLRLQIDQLVGHVLHAAINKVEVGQAW